MARSGKGGGAGGGGGTWGFVSGVGRRYIACGGLGRGPPALTSAQPQAFNPAAPRRPLRMIDTKYQPSEIEGRIYAAWEAAGAFRAGRPERRDAQPYCIVI